MLRNIHHDPWHTYLAHQLNPLGVVDASKQKNKGGTCRTSARTHISIQQSNTCCVRAVLEPAPTADWNEMLTWFVPAYDVNSTLKYPYNELLCYYRHS
jgi:hypothetical protein